MKILHIIPELNEDGVRSVRVRVRAESGECESGEWRVRVESGEWRAESGE